MFGFVESEYFVVDCCIVYYGDVVWYEMEYWWSVGICGFFMEGVWCWGSDFEGCVGVVEVVDVFFCCEVDVVVGDCWWVVGFGVVMVVWYFDFVMIEDFDVISVGF